jgi:hypothetical protein
VPTAARCTRAKTALERHELSLYEIPACWPAIDGRCGCGRGHPEQAVGKAPLVSWQRLVATPPSLAVILALWARWPRANSAVLLEPSCLLLIDTDSEAALDEATALGLPLSWEALTGKGRHRYYRAPADVVGKRTTRRGNSRAIDVLAGGVAITPPSRHRRGHQYRWVVPPGAMAVSDAPAWAVAMLREASAPALAPLRALPSTMPPVDVDALGVSARIQALIRAGTSGRYASRSEAVFAVLQALIVAGHDDATIGAVLLDPANGISAKPIECGRLWVAHEIARARHKCAVEVFRP